MSNEMEKVKVALNGTFTQSEVDKIDKYSEEMDFLTVIKEPTTPIAFTLTAKAKGRKFTTESNDLEKGLIDLMKKIDGMSC